MIVYFDGKYLPEEEAKVSVSDRGFLFGDGIFTTLLVDRGSPQLLQPHLERLAKQCVDLKIRPSKIEELIFTKLIQKNQAQTGQWRLKIIITGGNSSELFLPERPHGHLLITLKPYTPSTDEPLKLILYPHPIHHPHAQMKSLALLNRLFVKEYARERGVDDAITQTVDKILLETAFGNLFWVYEGRIYTPDPSLPLYFGVAISQLLEQTAMPVSYGKWRLDEIPEGARVYRSNSLTGIRPIGSVGGRAFMQNGAEAPIC